MRLVGQYWQKYNFPIHIHVLISQISNMFFPPVQALRARLAQIFRVRSPGWSRPQVCRPGLTADCRLHSDLLPPLISTFCKLSPVSWLALSHSQYMSNFTIMTTEGCFGVKKDRKCQSLPEDQSAPVKTPVMCWCVTMVHESWGQTGLNCVLTKD